MNEKFDVTELTYNDLTDEERIRVSNNGSGKENASYLRIIFPDGTKQIESDAMEPEDARFSRDLEWIKGTLNKTFAAGQSTPKGKS